MPVRVSIPDRVVRRPFHDETVVLDLESGRYFGLNATAGRMLDALGESGDPAAVAADIAAGTNAPLDQVAADVDQLCRELAAHDLLEVRDGD